MKGLLISAAALVIALLAVAAVPSAGVLAIGAPTENYTIPDLPTNDPSHEEIKPPVNYYLKAPTVQQKTSPPLFTAVFNGPLLQNKYAVTGDGQWYLDIDVNTPGWLYIYEYYPPNNNPTGRWLAYKWQLKQSGQWDIGPFTARSGEPEGQHVYRIWFYGNGQWAPGDSVTPQNGLIYWAYLKNLPELKIVSFAASPRDVRQGESVTLSWNVQGAQSLEIPLVGPVTGASGTKTVVLDQTTDFVLIATGLDGSQITSDTVNVNVSGPAAASTPAPSTPVTPSPPVKPASLYEQIFNPITGISVLAVIAIIVLGLLLRSVYLKRWAAPATVAVPDEEQTLGQPVKETPAPAPQLPITVRARLVLPEGIDIPLAANSQPIGRAELSRALGLDELVLISRKQFQVTRSDGQYFIEHLDGPNSTKLNGDDIKGKGTIELKDGDVIDIAGAIKLRFTVVEI
jgi:hypothetical protein